MHQFWGSNNYSTREARVYKNIPGPFEVEFWDNNKLIESREMKTKGIEHSERYAEDAAENWCMGII